MNYNVTNIIKTRFVLSLFFFQDFNIKKSKTI